MVQHDLSHDRRNERASVNGRAIFAMAAFVAGMGLVALLDRLGAPEGLVTPLAPALALGGFVLLGFLLRTMRISRFFAGGRMLPSAYVGAALLALAAGVSLPFTGLLPGDSGYFDVPGLTPGAALGLAAAGLLTGPRLRRAEALSPGDFVARRFPNLIVRLFVIAILAAICAFLALAAMEGAARALAEVSGLSRPATLTVVAGVLLALTLPGGAAGVVWGAAGAAAIMLVSLLLPLAMTGERVAAAVTQILPEAGLAGLGGGLADVASQAPSHLQGWLVVLASALGLAVLPVLLIAPMAAASPRGARRGGFLGLVFIVSAIGLAGLSIVASRQLFAAGAVPDAASLLARFADTHALGAAFRGLSGTALTAAMLALAAAGVQGFAGSLAHDGLFRLRDRGALTSRRLAFARLALIVGVVAGARLLLWRAPDPAVLAALAIALSAGLLFPLFCLVLWRPARSGDAVMGLLTGLAAAAAMLHLLASWPWPERLAGASCAAALAGLGVGLMTSFVRIGPDGQVNAQLPKMDRAA